MTVNSSARGFTMLEFSIVLVISGILMGAAIQAWYAYSQTVKYQENLARISTIDQSMSNYRNANTINACPSDPSLPVTDPNAGKSVTAVAGTVTECWAIVQSAGVAGWCNGAGQPYSNSQANSMCVIAGARDTQADADSAPDLLVSGGVPYVTLKAGIDIPTFSKGCPACVGVAQNSSATMDCYTSGTVTPQYCDMNADGVIDAGVYMPSETASFTDVSLSDALDPWGYQYSYVVTANATVAATYGSGQYGAIDVQTEQLVPLLQPPGIANYIIISHGDDHNGAYNAYGKIPYPCGLLPAAGGSADNYNCQFENGTGSVFIDGLRTQGTGTTHYDDVVKYQSATITKLWDVAGNSASNLYNLNFGNVGVGTGGVAPTERFEATQDALVQSTSNSESAQLCDENGANCWSQVLMGGYDSQNTSNPTNPSDVLSTGSPATGSNELPSGNQCPLTGTATKINVVKSIAGGVVTCTCPTATPNCATALAAPQVLSLPATCGTGHFVTGVSSAGLSCQ